MDNNEKDFTTDTTPDIVIKSGDWGSSNPLSDLLRLADIPDYLTKDRRANYFNHNFGPLVAQKQREYIRANPKGHMKKLIAFCNDYLDKNRLADTPKNQRKARDYFYLNTRGE